MPKLSYYRLSFLGANYRGAAVALAVERALHDRLEIWRLRHDKKRVVGGSQHLVEVLCRPLQAIPTLVKFMSDMVPRLLIGEDNAVHFAVRRLPYRVQNSS